MDWFDDLWRDFDRMHRAGVSALRMPFTPAAWALGTYRIGRALEAAPKSLATPLKLLHRPWERLVRAVTGARLSTAAEIGGGLLLLDTNGVHVEDGARIGRDAALARGARVGDCGRPAPFLCDRVTIGEDAVVSGDIRIGNDVLIGASTVVASDVADGGTVGSDSRPELPKGRRRPPLTKALESVVRTTAPGITRPLLTRGP